MPKRVLDFDAMWGSDKLASCAAWAQAEYAWLYGLADASGCFELTNLRVIWGRVAAIRGNLTLERLEQVFAEFRDKGLLFVWEHEGKRYGHWTGSDVPGRLPPPSWRMRLERLAPPVPKQQLAEYMARFARGRAGLAGVGFRAGTPEAAAERQEHFKFEISDVRCESSDLKEVRDGNFAAEERKSQSDAPPNGLKPCLEGHPAQDLGLVGDLGLNRDLGVDGNLVGSSSNSFSTSGAAPQFSPPYSSGRLSARELAVQRELRVGQGPACAPGSVKPEVIERDRQRLAARAGSKSG